MADVITIADKAGDAEICDDIPVGIVFKDGGDAIRLGQLIKPTDSVSDTASTAAPSPRLCSTGTSTPVALPEPVELVLDELEKLEAELALRLGDALTQGDTPPARPDDKPKGPTPGELRAVANYKLIHGSETTVELCAIKKKLSSMR